MYFFIYETDLRQKMICSFLENKGYTKLTRKDINRADIVVLPFVNAIEYISLDNRFFEKFKDNVVFFTGSKNIQLKEKFREKKINFIEIMDFESMAVLNSVPTSEGVVYNLLKYLDSCIFDSNILVLGYGICGSEISKKLKVLGANVDIFDGSYNKNTLAKIANFNIIGKEDFNEKKYEAIVNTIPEHVFTEENVNKLNRDTLILDIASSPFGFNQQVLLKNDINYKLLTGLPSKFGVKYSGENIGAFIYNYMEGE